MCPLFTKLPVCRKELSSWAAGSTEYPGCRKCRAGQPRPTPAHVLALTAEWMYRQILSPCRESIYPMNWVHLQHLSRQIVLRWRTKVLDRGRLPGRQGPGKGAALPWHRGGRGRLEREAWWGAVGHPLAVLPRGYGPLNGTIHSVGCGVLSSRQSHLSSISHESEREKP